MSFARLDSFGVPGKEGRQRRAGYQSLFVGRNVVLVAPMDRKREKRVNPQINTHIYHG